MKALNEGKEKILDCGLLILGKEQVGKTSLYRQMVGKEFLEDLDSTRGIDNKNVETVDRRDVDIHDDVWREMENHNAGDQFTKTLGAKVSADLPSKSADERNIDEIVEEGALLVKIRRTIQEIERLKRPPPPPKPPQPLAMRNPRMEELVATLTAGVPPPFTMMHNSPPLPKKQRMEDTNATPTQQPLPSPPAQPKVVREERPKQPTQPPARQPQVVAKKPTPPPQEEPAATPPPPQEEVEEVPDDLPPGIFSHRESAQFDEIIRGKEKPPAPRLHLNTLDFAGQGQYRPMHHCYIARRALYLVVFNCDEMAPCARNPEARPHKPIEDIRYWVQSINAHIYPPEPKAKNKEQKINRVILVGTHREGHTPEDLEAIDDLIESELIKPDGNNQPDDKICVNHICQVAGTWGNKLSYFVAVENSIDIVQDASNYLERSGTKFLQENVKDITKDLKFMEEEHPINWLKFKQLLERSKATDPPVMTVQEVKQLAVQSRITDTEQQELALRFFHDTRQIICLRKLCIVIQFLGHGCTSFFCRVSATVIFEW